jgi:hypothetical protein
MVSDTAVRQAIYQKLNVSSVTSLLGSGSASLVHAEAPPTANFPLCMFNKQSGITDHMAMGGTHMNSHLWLVKGVTRAPSASLAEQIDKAAYDLLHFGSLTITGADDLMVSRESDVNYSEIDGDTKYWHVGGLYRLMYQNT